MLATRSLARLSAALCFAYVLRPRILGVPTTALECVIIATLLTYLVEKLRARESFPDPRALPYFWPLILLLVAATISVLVPADHRAAAGIWKAYFVEPMLMAYVLADVLRTRADLARQLWGFYLGATLVAVLNIMVFVVSVGLHVPHLVENPPVIIYFSANATGLFLGPLLAMAAAQVAYGSQAERRIALAFIPAAAIALALSFSRGAWLGLGAALLFIAWQHRRRVMAFGAVVVAGLASLAIPAVRRRIGHEFNPRDPANSVNSRVDLWRATYHMMRTGLHPLFGSGLSGFKRAIAPFKDMSGYHEDLIYPHNLALNFYTETGLLGLAAFLWLAVAWVRRTVQALRTDGGLRPFHVAFAAASITIAVHGLLDVPFFKNDLAFLTLAIVGMQCATLRIEARRVDPRRA